MKVLNRSKLKFVLSVPLLRTPCIFISFSFSYLIFCFNVFHSSICSSSLFSLPLFSHLSGSFAVILVSFCSSLSNLIDLLCFVLTVILLLSPSSTPTTIYPFLFHFSCVFLVLFTSSSLCFTFALFSFPPLLFLSCLLLSFFSCCPPLIFGHSLPCYISFSYLLASSSFAIFSYNIVIVNMLSPHARC